MGDRKPVLLHRKIAQLPAQAAKETRPHTFLALERHAHRTDWDSNRTHAGIVKESFAVDIPFPVPSNQVFVIKGGPQIMYVVLPLKRESLEASGISTGGKPFVRSPMFDLHGANLADPPRPASRNWRQADRCQAWWMALYRSADTRSLCAP